MNNLWTDLLMFGGAALGLNALLGSNSDSCCSCGAMSDYYSSLANMAQYNGAANSCDPFAQSDAWAQFRQAMADQAEPNALPWSNSGSCWSDAANSYGQGYDQGYGDRGILDYVWSGQAQANGLTPSDAAKAMRANDAWLAHQLSCLAEFAQS
jgi:hypothetical protein